MQALNVILFRSADTASRFCKVLSDRGFEPDTMQIVGPDEIGTPETGEQFESSVLQKLTALFRSHAVSVDPYESLVSFLERQGLDRLEADYYTSEVREGSTLLVVRAGHRQQEVQDLADQWITERYSDFGEPGRGRGGRANPADNIQPEAYGPQTAIVSDEHRPPGRETRPAPADVEVERMRGEQIHAEDRSELTDRGAA